MKKIKYIKSILSSTKYIRLIIFIQIFMFLFMSVLFINRYNIQKITLKKLEKTPLKNSLLFMGNMSYQVIKDNKEINNYEEILSEKKIVNEYFKNNMSIFKGSTFNNKLYLFDLGGSQITLGSFDDNTLNTINPRILQEHIFNNNEDIEVLVSESQKDKYPLGTIFDLPVKEKQINIKVIGYYNKDTLDLQLGVVGNFAFPITQIINFRSEYNDYFITSTNNINLKYLSNFIPNGVENAMILYLNDDVKKEDLKEFESIVKDNQLGYYQFSEDMFLEQEEANRNEVQERFDLIISYIIILLFSILSIGYINRDILENRFKIYYYNGAKIVDIFCTSFIYYCIIIFLPIIFYNFFMYLTNIDYIKQNIITKFPTLYRMTSDDTILHLKEFTILAFMLLITIFIISLWQVKQIKEKYINLGDSK